MGEQDSPQRRKGRREDEAGKTESCLLANMIVAPPMDRLPAVTARIHMDIVIGSLLDGARQATGAVAIIDVFRAFTTAAVAFANGASRIVMVGSVEEALALRESGVADVCMGEVSGRAPPGFDFGNSPFQISDVDFAGRAIAQRTGAGTQGIIVACQAECLYAASLVTAYGACDAGGDGQQRESSHR
jgi:hypothetical protein